MSTDDKTLKQIAEEYGLNIDEEISYTKRTVFMDRLQNGMRNNLERYVIVAGKLYRVKTIPQGNKWIVRDDFEGLIGQVDPSAFRSGADKGYFGSFYDPYTQRVVEMGSEMGDAGLKSLARSIVNAGKASKKREKDAGNILAKKLKEHDWYYEQSDDNSVYVKGQAQKQEIMDLTKKVGVGAENIWKANAPKEFIKLKPWKIK